ncbi:MAG: hypothetical protein ACON4F_08235 [Candidatus Puniceispirillaceae bacterium]
MTSSSGRAKIPTVVRALFKKVAQMISLYGIYIFSIWRRGQDSLSQLLKSFGVVVALAGLLVPDPIHLYFTYPLMRKLGLF